MVVISLETAALVSYLFSISVLGEICLVQSEADGQWYRAIYIGNDDDDDSVADICLADFGPIVSFIKDPLQHLRIFHVLVTSMMLDSPRSIRIH